METLGEILYADQDSDVRGSFAAHLREAGFTVVEVDSAEDAMEHVRRKTPAVVLVEICMSSRHMSGVELLAQLHEHKAWTKIPTVVLSMINTIVNRDSMVRLGVRAVLGKYAASGADLVAAIRDVLRTRPSYDRIAPDTGSLRGIYGGVSEASERAWAE